MKVKYACPLQIRKHHEFGHYLTNQNKKLKYVSEQGVLTVNKAPKYFPTLREAFLFAKEVTDGPVFN